MKKCFITIALLFLAGAFSANVAMVTPQNSILINSPTLSSFSPQQAKEIHKIIHDYLVNNPSVLLEASQSPQKQAQIQQEQNEQKLIKQNAQKLFNDLTSPVAGNPKGNVTLVEFFDYQCRHCKAMDQIIQNLVKQNKDLRIVFKELPIFGDQSQLPAKVSLAAVRQGKYYVFHDTLLSTDDLLTNDAVFELAEKVGLNVDQLKKDINNPAIQKQLRDNFQLAQSIQLVGTPTFVIGNKALTNFCFIPGATSQQNLQSAISQLTK